jgi:pre-mRNA-splicing helicase BRR2
MSDYQRDVSQYKYSAMSNLVLQADRRFVTRRNDESTGDPESLAGKLSIGDMGKRVARDAAPKQARTQQLKVERGGIREGEDVLQRERKRKAETRTGLLGAGDSLEVEGIMYRPRTAETRDTYNLLVTFGARHLGDVPHDVVRSAVDAVLEYLKDDDLRDMDKKKEIDDILGKPLTAAEFNQLVNLGKKITDYYQQDDEAEGVAEDEADEADLDGRHGVAVAFDEDEDEDEVVNEIRGDSDSDSDDVEGDGDEDLEAAAAEAAAAAAAAARPDGRERGGEDRDDDDDEELILDAAGAGGKGAQEKGKKQVAARDIDAFWLQRQIGKLYPDAHEQADKTKEAMRLLSGRDEEAGEERPLREIENDLMELFEYEHHELVQKLIQNREKVWWLTRLAKAESGDEKTTIEREMASEGLGWILNELYGKSAAAAAGAAAGTGQRIAQIKVDPSQMDLDAPETEAKQEGGEDGQPPSDGRLRGGLAPRRTINLENLVFDQGNHLMTNAKVRLPEGSTKRTFKGYEEIHVPVPKKHADKEGSLIPITTMPEWSRVPFAKNKSLNRIQSTCYPSAFEGDGNMLVCAPTGSGKTNVAMLAMLREIGKNRNAATGEIDLDAFKIVCIAPLKALVQEQVRNYGGRLAEYGIRVAELTGDRQLTKQQIAETQVIVTTPEKWDVITRKATDLTYTNLVRLIVIDEIHLLHDDRGPVLESIVSRTLRKSDQTGEPTRIVGLSATLPNYVDVASFLRVDQARDMFHFDGSFRPCPLRQEFVGITDRKAIKQLKTMNDVTYNKVLEHVGTNRNQMIIFVHSRKETARTAKYIRDKALEMDTINQILKHDSASREVLKDAADSTTDRDLRDILPYGFGIHHAGMNRADRTDVEDLFEKGAIQVLVCTATLAWGVNLPAHTVVIKGTQVYSPEKGGWVELSPQDVLQMLGRAGRPQFDTYGEGIIITTQTEMQYYLSLLNQQLPIESQFVSRLVDNLNAEVVLGNVRSRDEAVDWLGYSYLYVRMLRSPGLYQVGAEYEDDTYLEQKRVDLVHSAAVSLQKSGLVKYNEKTGELRSTDLGKIASHYYITHASMDTYSKLIQPGTTTIELFRVFALSQEFKYIPVRQDEKLELAKMLLRVPIPVKESIEEPHAKINVLLQAYISRLKLEGLALMADMVYVTQSAGRILRAMFEIAMRKGSSAVAATALDLCKMAEQRMWPTMTPLRQFAAAATTNTATSAPNLAAVVQKAERMDVPWESYYDLDPPRMGELLGMPKMGKTVCDLVAKFPRVELKADCRPITKSMLHIRLSITPLFEWDDRLHGAAQSFWILLEDCDGEDILYSDVFLLRKDLADTEHVVEFTAPIIDPMPPHYFVSVVSDRWMHSRAKLPIVFHKLILPDKFPPHTDLLDLQPLPVSTLKAKELVRLYPDWEAFNKIQTQTFNALYNTDANVFVGAPTGSGKTVCAEFALLRHWTRKRGSSTNDDDVGRAVYVAPLQELVDIRHRDWEARFGGFRGGKTIAKLTGEVAVDLKLLEGADLVLATPLQWDVLSRQWKRRKNVQTVSLFIADEVHMIGDHGGGVYEIVVARMHYMRTQTELPLRIVALSVPMANARDVGEWINAGKHDIYNFAPSVRPVPMELHVQSYSVPHFPSLMLAMAKPAYLAIKQLSADRPAIVFVPNRKQTRATARDLLAACHVDGDGSDGGDDDRFLHAPREQLEPLLARVHEAALAEAIRHGVGYYHEALSQGDKKIVKYLFDKGAVQVLVASRDVCWELDSAAHLVVVMGTQYFDGIENRYLDYPLSEVLHMFGRAARPAAGRVRGVLMVPAVRREYYKKFLNEALPVESQLLGYMGEAFVNEVSTANIESGEDAINWTTFTYFYRRLLANPSFYGLASRSQDAISEYMTELIETTLRDLSEAKIIDFDEDEGTVAPENPATIAAYYNISCATMETFLKSLRPTTKLKGILEIVTAAYEFETMQMRRHEEGLLRRIYDRLPVKLRDADAASPHFKAFVLLQAHFSRMQLPIDLAKDQEVILAKVLSLLSAMVDILSSEGHLNAMNAMEMSQMVVQAMWDRDSPLKQIPHFGPDAVAAAAKFGVRTVFEFMDAMNPDENPDAGALVKALGLTQAQLAEAAAFTNDKHPDIELEMRVLDEDAVVAGEPATLEVTLQRNVEEEEEEEGEVDTSVHAPFFPVRKLENWWLVVADEAAKTLLGIKRVSFGKMLKVKVPFVVGRAGRHGLKLVLMSDSYVGVDQEHEFGVQVAEGEDEDEDEEESGAEGGMDVDDE